jgi:hypothetical protein
LTANERNNQPSHALQTDSAEGFNGALGTYINQHVTVVHLPDVPKATANALLMAMAPLTIVGTIKKSIGSPAQELNL